MIGLRCILLAFLIAALPTGATAAVLVSSVSETANTPTPSDNDYKRINDAIQAAADGDTLELRGIFDWTEANAAASWALGSDGAANTGNEYAITVPATTGLTITAAALGDATI